MMHKSIDSEVGFLRKNYEELSLDLTQKNKTIFGDIKDKFTSIKTTVATYFAKMDAQTTTINEKLMKLETLINQCQVGAMNPSIENDGKLFALKT